MPSTILICDTVNPPTLKLEYPDILISPYVVDGLFVETTANSSLDSSQINACVAPVPLLIIIPESNTGDPD